VISQCSLAIPTILLFEASLISVRMVEKRKAAEEAARVAKG
jgi:sec-independent protein translocase protein TatC